MKAADLDPGHKIQDARGNIYTIGKRISGPKTFKMCLECTRESDNWTMPISEQLIDEELQAGRLHILYQGI